MVRGDKNDHSWIRTFTGRQFWPLEPLPGDVCIEDIAHHLAQKCRWTGATRLLYTIAEHSVRVARWVQERQPEHTLTALLHDATEAYLPDMSRPLKHSSSALGKEFSKVERRVWSDAIWPALGEDGSLPRRVRDFPEIVHTADDILLNSEGRHLVAEYEWSGPVLVWVEPMWSPERAEREFLGMYYELTGARPPITTISMDWIIAESKRISDARLATDIALADTFTTAQYAQHIGLKRKRASELLADLERQGVITRTTIQSPRSTGRGSYLYPTPAWRYTGESTPSTQGTQATTQTSPTTLATKELYQDGVSPRAVRLQGTSHSADPRARDATAAGAGTAGRRRGKGVKKAVAQSPATRGAGRRRPTTVRAAGVRAGRRRTGA